MAAVDGFAVPAVVLRHFDLTNTPYDEQFAEDVVRRRRSFPDQKLFLDRLFDLIGVDGSAMYPPTTPAALRRVLHAVHSSDADRLKQDCFYYYLLRDADGHPSKEDGLGMEQDADGSDGLAAESSRDAQSRSSATKAGLFARRRCLPRMWTVFIDGYHALDHGSWEDAVQRLSDPAITQLDFISDILNTLASQVSPPSLALSLIHSFLQATHYNPTTPSDTEIHLLALASYSVPAAFAFIRSIDASEMRTRLREAVWCWALGAPRGSCGKGKHGVQKRAMEEILHLPLLPEEDAHLVHFLSHPPKSLPSARLSLLHDLVTLRLVHSGQYAESLQLDRDLAGSAAGDEDDRQRRREMVREFIAILPEAQRRVLRTEGDVAAGRREQDRREMANGFVADESAAGTAFDEEDEQMDADEPTLPAFASGSSAAATLLSRQAAGSPAPGTPRARVSSPFGGPPRFASGLGVSQASINTPPTHRILSDSPFKMPASIAAAATPSKQPKEILDDDEIVSRRRSGRGLRRSESRAVSLVPTEVESVRDPSEEAMPPPPVPAKRRGSRKEKEKEQSVVDHEETEDAPAKEPSPEKAKEPTPEPEPTPRKQSKRVVSSSQKETKTDGAQSSKASPATPPAPSRASTRRRQSTAPSKTATGTGDGDGVVMPGSFESSRQIIEGTPATSSRQSSAAPESNAGRSRLTRSVSRALLDDDTHEPERAAKKSRYNNGNANASNSNADASDRRSARALSVVSEAPSASATPRRSTRRGTVQPSERGSPTPSLVSVAGSTRSTRTERSTRGGSVARGESATPRATRSRR